MPKGFDMCRKSGGKIRNKKLGGGKYVPICTLNGKSYRGYTKSKGSDKKEGGSPVAAAIKKRMGKKYGG